jgi:hypothetical protein
VNTLQTSFQEVALPCASTQGIVRRWPNEVDCTLDILSTKLEVTACGTGQIGLFTSAFCCNVQISGEKYHAR